MKHVRRNGLALSDFDKTLYQPTKRISNTVFANKSPSYRPVIRNGIREGDFPLNGLVFYAPLYLFKGAGFNSIDPFGHTCTVNGATWGSQGRFFDGVNDKITIPDHSALNITGNITCIVWVRFEVDDADLEILCKWEQGVALTLLFMRTADNILHCFFGGASGDNAAESLLAVTINTWYHIAAYYDGSKTALELNGIDQADAQTPLAPVTTVGTDFLIGEREDGTNDLTGRVGEVWIYNRALTTAEIAHNYRATKWRYS